MIRILQRNQHKKFFNDGVVDLIIFSSKILSSSNQKSIDTPVNPNYTETTLESISEKSPGKSSFVLDVIGTFCVIFQKQLSEARKSITFDTIKKREETEFTKVIGRNNPLFGAMKDLFLNNELIKSYNSTILEISVSRPRNRSTLCIAGAVLFGFCSVIFYFIFNLVIALLTIRVLGYMLEKFCKRETIIIE